MSKKFTCMFCQKKFIDIIFLKNCGFCIACSEKLKWYDELKEAIIRK